MPSPPTIPSSGSREPHGTAKSVHLVYIGLCRKSRAHSLLSHSASSAEDVNKAPFVVEATTVVVGLYSISVYRTCALASNFISSQKKSGIRHFTSLLPLSIFF